MWLLPYEKFTISTQLSPQDVIKNIRAAIYIPGGYVNKDDVQLPGKYFRGFILNNKFELQQNIVVTARGWKLPEIKGEIISVGHTTEVYIKISTLSTLYYTLIIAVVLVLIGIAIFLRYNQNYYIFFAIAIGYYLSDLIVFKIIIRRIPKILLEILKGDMKST